MDRNRKIELNNYYLSLKCRCGQDKHMHRWTCKDCTRKLRGSPEEVDMELKCDMHLDSVEVYLSLIK